MGSEESLFALVEDKNPQSRVPRWPGGPSVCTRLRPCSVLGVRIPFTTTFAACLSPSLSPTFLSISSLMTINKGKKPKTNLKKKKKRMLCLNYSLKGRVFRLRLGVDRDRTG